MDAITFRVFELRDLSGCGDLHVFDSQAEIVAAIRCSNLGVVRRFLGAGKSVERHLHALIPDRVKANLEAGQHALFRHVIQLGGVVARQAGVLGIVRSTAPAGPRCAIRESHP